MIRDSAKKVTPEVVATRAAQRDKTGAWPHKEVKAAAELGFLGM